MSMNRAGIAHNGVVLFSLSLRFTAAIKSMLEKPQLSKAKAVGDLLL